MGRIIPFAKTTKQEVPVRLRGTPATGVVSRDDFLQLEKSPVDECLYCWHTRDAHYTTYGECAHCDCL